MRRQDPLQLRLVFDCMFHSLEDLVRLQSFIVSCSDTVVTSFSLQGNDASKVAKGWETVASFSCGGRLQLLSEPLEVVHV